MINFDSLPTENPFAIPAVGVYKALIADAEMRAPKDTAKKDYLNMKFDLYDGDKKIGTIYDILSESDSSVVQYKTGRFLTACGIPLSGSMELKDLAKIVKGKWIVVDVSHDKREPERIKAQVDVFSRGAYYSLDQYAEAKAAGGSNEGTPSDDFMEVPAEDTVFNAPDGAATPSPASY